MPVAIVKSNYTPYGGGEKYTQRLIDAFIERGYEVHLLTAHEWPVRRKGLRLIRMKMARWNNLLRLITFNASVKEYLRKTPYELVLGMDRTEVQTHLRAGGGSHRAYLQRRSEEVGPLKRLSFWLNPFHRKMLQIEVRSLRWSGLRRVICNSHMVYREFLRYYPWVKDKLAVIHNGVEWEDMEAPFEESERDRPSLRRAMSLDPDGFYFLFVGSGFERKGLWKVLSSLRQLPEAGLLVVGGDRRPERYLRMAQEMGLSDRVRFYGPRSDVIRFYQVSDAFVLPTIYDPFSNATLEALAMGLYVITTDGNGCAEVIGEGAGEVVSDTGELTEAMARAINGNHDRKAIRESVREYDFSRKLGELVDLCVGDIT